MVVNRRIFLKTFSLAALAAAFPAAVSRILETAGRGRDKVSSNILILIRKKTRPLTTDRITGPNDLAG